MDLLQLRYFCALAKNEHLTITARELMVSAPSLSLTIKKLEKELGVELFDRVGRDIRLNSAGKIFYHYINRSLMLMNFGMSEAVRVGLKKKELMICFSNPYIWQEYIDSFRSAYPDIAVKTQNSTCQDKINNLKYDFYLGNLFGLKGDQFCYEKLMDPEVGCIIMNQKNPLSGKESVTMEDLKNETFFNFSESVDAMKHEILTQMSKQMDYIPKVMEGDYLLRYKWLKENKCIALGTDIGFQYNYPEKENLVAVKLKDDIMPKRMQVIAWNSELEIVGERKLFFDYMVQATKSQNRNIDM